MGLGMGTGGLRRGLININITLFLSLGVHLGSTRDVVLRGHG